MRALLCGLGALGRAVRWSLWSKGDVSAGRGGGVVCANFFSLLGIFFFP